MNGTIWTSLLFSFAGLVIGFMGGQAVLWKRRGSLIVPTYHPVGRRSNLVIGLLIVLLAIGTLANGVYAQNKQANCNTEFRRVLSERADLTRDRTAAQVDLQRRLIAVEDRYPPESLVDPGPRIAYLTEKERARADYIKAIEKIDAERAANPYPSPRC